MGQNKYKKLWEKLEVAKPRPAFSRKLIIEEYDNFAEKIERQDDNFVNTIVNSIYEGDTYLLKNGFSKNFCDNLRKDVIEVMNSTEPGFHKIL